MVLQKTKHKIMHSGNGYVLGHPLTISTCDRISNMEIGRKMWIEGLCFRKELWMRRETGGLFASEAEKNEKLRHIRAMGAYLMNRTWNEHI